MKEYTFTEARQHFASILENAKKDGAVCIKKRDGEAFYITPATQKLSPLDVDGVNLGITSAEIVDVVKEGRENTAK